MGLDLAGDAAERSSTLDLAGDEAERSSTLDLAGDAAERSSTLGLDSLTDDLLAGLPPGPDWSVLLEIGSERQLVRVVDGSLRREGPPGINATWDVGFAVSDEEWADFCADPPPRGATSAQALVATRGSERITGRREVWARAAPAIDRFLEAL